MDDDSNFDLLLSRYFDGTLSTSELAELDAKLVADEAFAEHVSRWCLVHRQIIELLTETRLHDLMDQFVQGTPGLPRRAFHQTAAAIPDTNLTEAIPVYGNVAGHHDRLVKAHAYRRRPWHGWILAGLAAALLATFTWWATHDLARRLADDSRSTTGMVAAPGLDESTPRTETPRSPDPTIAATLTQVVDGVWAPGAPVLRHGQLLEVGTQVALASGMCKVTYDCGAEVVLEGPCDFWLQSPMVGYLNSGRITANVPRRAFSFAILSPHVDMVDLGTSFGVDVGVDGRTELHVFEGEVLCSEPRGGTDAGQRRTSPVGPAAGERVFRMDRSPSLIHVTAENAMEFGAAPGRPSDIAINKQQFARLIALRRAADFTGGHLVEDKLALWLAADVAVTTDRQQRVISWQDIVYGDNQSAEDAIQTDENARPRLVPDSVNTRPAIRFDGNSDFLLTTPLETTDDQTVLMVIQYSSSAFADGRRWGGQILNYDGPPSRYLSNTLEPGVLQIGEPLLEEQFQPTLISGQVFAGFIGSATVEAGRVDTAQVGADNPVIVAFVYDYEYEHGKASLAINGRQYGTARAFAPQGITSRKIIGRHAWMQNYFQGDLAELLIFNKALSADELAQTTTYLSEKYGIPLDSSDQSQPSAE